MSKPGERTFQNDMIEALISNGWLLGESKNYNRQLALYEEDLLGFVKESQPKEWQKYEKTYGDKAKSAIELMQERRTALISAAVTGKIDVRGWEEKDKGERMQDKREEAKV